MRRKSRTRVVLQLRAPAMNSLSLRRLYIAVAIFAVIPIWCVRYLPTVDGPSHVYNSWILHELIRGAQGPIADWFRIDWRPHPNWIGHALPVVLAIGSIGLLWLMTLRGRRPLVHARHLIAFLPVAPLLIWFRTAGAAYLRGFATTRGELLRFMARMRILYAFDERQLVY